MIVPIHHFKQEWEGSTRRRVLQSSAIRPFFYCKYNVLIKLIIGCTDTLRSHRFRRSVPVHRADCDFLIHFTQRVIANTTTPVSWADPLGRMISGGEACHSTSWLSARQIVWERLGPLFLTLWPFMRKASLFRRSCDICWVQTYRGLLTSDVTTVLWGNGSRSGLWKYGRNPKEWNERQMEG
jgi:hypothetical protein